MLIPSLKKHPFPPSARAAADALWTVFEIAMHGVLFAVICESLALIAPALGGH